MGGAARGSPRGQVEGGVAGDPGAPPAQAGGGLPGGGRGGGRGGARGATAGRRARGSPRDEVEGSVAEDPDAVLAQAVVICGARRGQLEVERGPSGTEERPREGAGRGSEARQRGECGIPRNKARSPPPGRRGAQAGDENAVSPAPGSLGLCRRAGPRSPRVTHPSRRRGRREPGGPPCGGPGPSCLGGPGRTWTRRGRGRGRGRRR